MQQNILTINAGSSSVKFALFELTDHISEKAAISGQIDGIGTDQVKLVAKDRSGTRIVDQALPAGANHAQGFDHLHMRGEEAHRLRLDDKKWKPLELKVYQRI